MSGNPGLYYKGDVKIQRYNADGTLSPVLIGPIGGTKLGLKATNEVKKRFSREKATHGKLVGSAAMGKPTELSIEFNEANSAMLAIVFLGDEAALSVSGGTATGESFTAKLDQWVKLAQENITSPAITGKTEGTDYVIDRNIGAVKALSTGSIVDGASTSINYTYGAVTGTQIKAGTNSQVKVKVWLDGENLENGDQVMVIVPKASLTPNGEIDFLADDYQTVSAGGETEFVTGETAEYYVRNKVVRA